MTFSLSRRAFTAGGLATILAGRVAGAQDGGTHLDRLDLPSLDISVTSGGFGGVPEELPAGRYLVNVSLEDGLERGGAGFVRPPEGLSADQFILELQSSSEVVPQDADTPEPDSTSDRLPVGAPIVAYDAMFAGGVMTTDGETGHAVVDLGEGEWVVWSGGFPALQTPLIVTVTGEMPEDAAEPQADVDVTLAGGTVGIDASLPAGEHVIRISHDGDEPHALDVLRGPDDLSDDDLDVVLRARLGGGVDEETDALPFDPEGDFGTVLSTAAQSHGAVQWVQVSLEPGTYVAMCTFVAREDAEPHALNGEATIFTVS